MRDVDELHRSSDDAIVRHDEHQRRAHVALDGFAYGERAALASGETDHTRASTGRVAAAQRCGVADERAIALRLFIRGNALLELTSASHLEAVAHDELAASRKPSMAIQTRQTFEQHAGTRIGSNRGAGDNDRDEALQRFYRLRSACHDLSLLQSALLDLVTVCGADW